MMENPCFFFGNFSLWVLQELLLGLFDIVTRLLCSSFCIRVKVLSLYLFTVCADKKKPSK